MWYFTRTQSRGRSRSRLVRGCRPPGSCRDSWLSPHGVHTDCVRACAHESQVKISEYPFRTYILSIVQQEDILRSVRAFPESKTSPTSRAPRKVFIGAAGALYPTTLRQSISAATSFNSVRLVYTCSNSLAHITQPQRMLGKYPPISILCVPISGSCVTITTDTLSR